MKLLQKLEHQLSISKQVCLRVDEDSKTSPGCKRNAYFDPLTFAELEEIIGALRK
jgi:hypothetical protein